MPPQIERDIYDALDALVQLRSDFDFEAPDAVAIANARTVVGVALEVGEVPARVLPGEGSVCLYFRGHGERWGNIECYNDGLDGGVIMAASHSSGAPEVWTVPSVRADILAAVRRVSGADV